MKYLAFVLFDIGAFELIVVNTYLWWRSEKIIKIFFPHFEPFRRVGIFRTPVFSKNMGECPDEFRREFRKTMMVKHVLGVTSIFLLLLSSYVYANI